MPICKNCGLCFPNRIEIDRKDKNLSNRKYCLVCSPFGKHNTRPIIQTEQSTTNKTLCKQCGRSYTYVRNKGHTKDKCNSCLVNYRRFQKKLDAIAYKGGKCEKCGYEKCIRNLCFHHLDPTKKDFSISGKHCYSWKRITSELDKCILICANCHGEIHEEIDNLAKEKAHIITI